ncbi:MAG: glycogen synthase [Waddliaceae bacterium]|nr:glycogen synthase [Waddliaceae bacterium]
MHIIHLAPEIAPIAKVGGLADVVYGLSKAQKKAGHTCTIILPKYASMNTEELDYLEKLPETVHSTFEGKQYSNSIWKGSLENLDCLFIEPHTEHAFFDREQQYGYDDDIARFLYFCRAALELLCQRQIEVDILHLHDWQSAIAAPLYYDTFQAGMLKPCGICYTIHNIAYQGHCSPNELYRAGLDGHYYLQADKLQDPHDPNCINLMKGGIVYSNHVNTVSPSYAQEVLTLEGGKGLDGVLHHHQDKFSGVLNGIDLEAWNPAKDSRITYPYSRFSEKKKNKKALQKELGMSVEERPLVAVISRLVEQKGVHLMERGIHETLARGGQFIVLGNGPDRNIMHRFYELQRQYAENPNIRFLFAYNETLSHKLYAAADLLLIPSLFEPCGLTQMIGLRYGTIPIVRETGGLADTIFDIDYSIRPEKERYGFSFRHPDFGGVDSALHRALDLWENDQKKWKQLGRRGMKADFSWNISSLSYQAIYDKIAVKSLATGRGASV